MQNDFLIIQRLLTKIYTSKERLQILDDLIEANASGNGHIAQNLCYGMIVKDRRNQSLLQTDHIAVSERLQQNFEIFLKWAGADPALSPVVAGAAQSIGIQPSSTGQG